MHVMCCGISFSTRDKYEDHRLTLEHLKVSRTSLLHLLTSYIIIIMKALLAEYGMLYHKFFFLTCQEPDAVL